MKKKLNPNPPKTLKQAIKFAKRQLQKTNKNFKKCMAEGHGDCFHPYCPQLRDGEPHKTGRDCLLDKS